jgi:ABC-2 type transport system permease protein
MFNSRLTSLIRKEFIQVLRDPRTLVIVLVIPVMQLFLLGYSANNDVRNVSLAVFDQDRSPQARALLDAYRAADYFEIAFDVDSEDMLRDLIDDGLARAGLIIPPDYSSRLLSNDSAEVAFVLDGSDPTVASTALSAAQLIGQEYATGIMADRLARSGFNLVLGLPVEVALTSILTATAIVRERERGTIEQLIVTPIRPWELVLGKLLPYTILALLNTLEVLAIGSYWFDVPIRGDLGLILVLSALFLMSSLGIGLLASTIANTQQEAMLTVWMLLLPSLFLSGFFFPIEAMPRVLQWVSYFIPLRYYLVIIRSLMLKGVGANALRGEIIALAIFGFGIMAAAALRFRKRLD